MALFGFLNSDPSRAWGDQRSVPVVLDIRRGALCGVSLRQPASDLSRFGRPDNRTPFKIGQFHYGSMGLEIDIRDDRITHFGLVIVQTAADHVGGCRPTVIPPGGATLKVDDSTPIETFLAHLPTPRGVDELDEDDVTYFIDLGNGLSLEIESSRAGHIRRINLNAE